MRWPITWPRWRAGAPRRGVDLAPHGKTHMSPQLAAKQLAAGACAITVATISQVADVPRVRRERPVLANELVDPAGLRWLAAELNADPDFRLVCWVDSVRGVEMMTAELAGCRVAAPARRLRRGGRGGRAHGRRVRYRDRRRRAGGRAALHSCVWSGVAGYEAALGHDVSADGRAPIRAYLRRVRTTCCGWPAGRVRRGRRHRGRQHTFRSRRRVSGRGWPDGLAVRTILRSGCYLTHDDGLYRRTSPLTAGGSRPRAECVGAGVLAARTRLGTADDGSPRRVLRPGSAGPAGLPAAP